jgi:hypothetical protein
MTDPKSGAERESSGNRTVPGGNTQPTSSLLPYAAKFFDPSSLLRRFSAEDKGIIDVRKEPHPFDILLVHIFSARAAPPNLASHRHKDEMICPKYFSQSMR